MKRPCSYCDGTGEYEDGAAARMKPGDRVMYDDNGPGIVDDVHEDGPIRTAYVKWPNGVGSLVWQSDLTVVTDED